MEFLTKELAQDIVERTMTILNKNINVMDEYGVIIGSGDLQRINQKHDGAVRVLEKNESVEISKEDAHRLNGAKPGINLPIKFNHRTVGVVGITGEPDQIRNYAELVKMAAEMVIEQSFLLEQNQWKQRLKSEMANQLLHDDAFNERLLKEKATALGIDLDFPHVVIFIESKNNITNGLSPAMIRSLSYELNKSDLMDMTYNNEVIILKSILTKDYQTDLATFISRINHALLLERENHYNIATGPGVSNFKEIKLSYRLAKKTLEVGQKLMPNQRVFYYEDYQFEVLLASLNKMENVQQVFSFYEKLAQGDKKGELRDTLKALINESGELNKVAEKLFIHRNTLRYRLDKIKDLTGKDPRVTADLLQLYTAYLLFELS